MGEEPWRYLVASRSDAAQFDRLLALLVPKNQEWARHAGALAISVAKKTFTRNGVPNRFHLHDTGTAFGQLSLQAVALGLQVHGMGGFDAEKTRTEFAIPDDFEVGAAFAIGYLDGDGAPPEGRKRRPLSSGVHRRVGQGVRVLIPPGFVPGWPVRGTGADFRRLPDILWLAPRKWPLGGL